uniref:26S proteasome non-ATPase regulatory subunit 5 n=1 Tax=Panagrolaimus sp. PS1159 TaxID=55785 RepID=A0AC35F6E2_9BILA
MYKNYVIFIQIFLLNCLPVAKTEEELLVTEINWRKINDVEKLSEYAKNEDLGFQLAAVRQARRLLSCKKAPPYDKFIQSGILPTLVKFMDSKNTTLQFDSTWILAHIASGTGEQTAAIVEAGSIPSFINLLNSPNKEIQSQALWGLKIQSQALWGLSHIIDKSPESRNECINSGIIQAFAKLADSEVTNLANLRNIAWSLKNLCKHEIGNNLMKIEVIQEILPIFEKFLESNDSLILSETLSGVANCGNGSHTRIQTIISYKNLIKKIIPFLKYSNAKVQHSALNVIKIISKGNVQQKKILLDNGILEYMLSPIKSQNKQIKHSVLYILGKIMSAKHQQNDQIWDPKLIHEIVKLLKYNDYQIRIDAAKIIVFISMQPKYIKTLIKYNVVSRLCKILRHPLKDENDSVVVLTALKNIIENSNKTEKKTILKEMKNSGGTSLFSNFENRENDKIKSICKEIINFFDN